MYETKGFWDQARGAVLDRCVEAQSLTLALSCAQVKSPGLVLRASELYMAHFRSTQPALLLAPREDGPHVVGNCYVHTSAKVHPTAKLGPNVSVAPGARVGPGARLINCILLDDVEVRDNAVVHNAIVGWKSSIGRWARVQGTVDADSSTKITVAILGEDVKVSDEVVVVNCIVLPHKEIKARSFGCAAFAGARAYAFHPSGQVSVKDEVIL